MVFPQTPRTIYTEMFLNNDWRDITSDVYSRDSVIITRGARDETSRAEPSRCQLTLNNRSGNYSPRNPNGSYYGNLGRNTPLRVSVGKDIDTFTRTVSSGWGSTDLGSVWSTFGHGGTIAASDYNVASGVGTVSAPAVNVDRIAYLGGQIYGDVDIAITTSLTLASVTGGAVGPAGIILRGVDSENYSQVFVFVDQTTGTIKLNAYDKISGSFFALGADLDTGITYSASQPMRVRAQKEGPFLRAKVWQPALTGEPYDWQMIAATEFSSSGWIGIESDVALGNTNTKPIIFTYDKLVVRVPRFAGEVSYWPQRWDTADQDFYVPIEASGIKRRLGQGTAPINSAMLTEVTRLDTLPIAYWTCEDGAAATQISALIGGNPMFVTGSTKFADFSGFACSQPLPSLSVGRWQGRVPGYTSSGYLNVRFLLHVPSSEPPDNWPIVQLFTTGTAPQYEIKYSTGGELRMNVWSPGGILYDSAALPFFFTTDTLIDSLWMISLTLHQNGADIDIKLDALQAGSSVSSVTTTTLAGRTVGKAISVVVDQFQKMRDVSVGHITVRDEPASPSIFDTSYGLNAYSGAPEIGGETALNRIIRLVVLADVPTDWQGDPTATPMMGAQRPLPLLTLLEESADVDMGVLHERRGALGLVYRARKSIYNQAAAFTLNYTGKQVAPPLEPVDDDQQTRNDIIVKRTDGGSFELFLSSGRLAIIDPWFGGVGLYTDAPTLNVDFDDQLADLAGWRLLLGTVDEARFPTIKVNLANSNVVAAGLDNAVMTANVGDRIVITNAPTRITPDLIAQIVRGYTETLNVFEHTISFICAPASPYDVIRADVAGKMTVDSDASSLASGVTTTATSLSVATTAGNALWITGAVNFDIAIEGERITVTNITGGSSPQTFTVTRSVNGVIKTHGSGVTVRLFRPAIVGL